MARKPDEPSEPLREWRVSILRDKVHHLGRVVAADKEAAIDRAMAEFRIEPARRFRMLAEPVKYRSSSSGIYAPNGNRLISGAQRRHL